MTRFSVGVWADQEHLSFGALSIEHGEIASLLEDSAHRFAPMPPFKLAELTRDDKSAWSRHYSSGNRGVEIPKSSVREEYRSRFGRGN